MIPRMLPSWNVWMRAYWTDQRATQKHWDTEVLVAVGLTDLSKIKLDPGAGKVRLMTTVYQANNPMDADNVCDKPLIDALRERFIHDDSPVFVSETVTRSRTDAFERTEILIYETRS